MWKRWAYHLYDSDDIVPTIQEDDIVLYENVFYKVQEITDIVHYNVLYSISLERVDVDG